MIKLLYYIVLQLYWYLCVFVAPKQYELLILGVIILIGHFYLVLNKKYLFKNSILFLSFVVIYGAVSDFLAESLGLVSYYNDEFPLWLTSLWSVFICYYEDFKRLFSKYTVSIQFLIGAVGGVFAYNAGSKSSHIIALSNFYYVFVFFSWGIFFSLSLYIYKKLMISKSNNLI